MSTTELAQRGFVGDALTVARTIVELAIDLGYIESDPGTLVRRFRDYADVRNREMAEAINELYGGTVAPAVMQVLRDRAEAYIGNEPNSEYSWAAVGRERRGVGWRAEKVAGSEQRRSDYRRMYSLLYSEMCGASHSGTITLEYTMTNGASERRLDARSISATTTMPIAPAASQTMGLKSICRWKPFAFRCCS